jgi:hypothetical protein
MPGSQVSQILMDALRLLPMTNAKKELTGFKCRFSLEQRLEYHRDCEPFPLSYLGVMQAIASEFNGTLLLPGGQAALWDGGEP